MLRTVKNARRQYLADKIIPKIRNAENITGLARLLLRQQALIRVTASRTGFDQFPRVVLF